MRVGDDQRVVVLGLHNKPGSQPDAPLRHLEGRHPVEPGGDRLDAQAWVSRCLGSVCGAELGSGPAMIFAVKWDWKATWVAGEGQFWATGTTS